MRLGGTETAPLLAGLAEEYERRYGASHEMSTTHAGEFVPPDGGFLVLLDEGRTLAGGGIRRLSADTCEVKRMWTAPGERRRGHASTVLRGLEELARSLGYTRLWLETGPAQPEALAMYERAGYRPISVYGRYPVARAFEKELTAPETGEP